MTFASPYTLFLLIPILAFVWYIGFPRQRFRRSRDIASLILRSTLILLIVLALAGIQVIRTVDKLAVIFLLDASDSMGAALEQAQLDYIEAALLDKPVDDEWALVVFGGDVSIDRPFNNISAVSTIRSTVLGNNTNLADGIQTAISLFPADARRRIVILSDGRETVGSAEAKARLAEASGVEISYALFSRPPQPDTRIVDFTAPQRVGAGQEFDMTVTIEAENATTATLIITSRGTQVSATNESTASSYYREEELQLTAGINRFSITERSLESGFLNFSAQLDIPSSDDDFTQNNFLGTFSEVVGPPRVLLVSSNPIDIEHLMPALQNIGVTLDIITPSNLPGSITGLAQYDSIVLVNIPATDLRDEQMRLIQSYVRDIGGGLVVVGGPDAYGPGGYFQTPLEEILPVEMQIRDQQRLPQLTIAYLVDRSGSMGASGDDIFTNLQLAQRAITLSIDFLQPSDRVAVGTFDSNGAWVAEFQAVNDRRRLEELVDTLRPGGGTDIMAGLRLVQRDIINEPSELKHLILITDGGASSIGLVRLVEELHNDYGVTLSVLAIGNTTPGFLRDMAEVGEGNYRVIADVSQIPNVLAQETVLATRSYIEEGEFALIRTANNPMVDGFSSLPVLNGYVATSSKDIAQVVLRGPEPNNDPILATWQYGLGRAVAFTSDATSRWSTEWVEWDGFPRFWGQVINYSITESAEDNIEPQIIMEEDHARIIVDARSDNGTFLNNLQLQAGILLPTGEAQSIPLLQTAPGRYEAIFYPDSEGAYFVTVSGDNLQGETIQEVRGWVLGYSAEYIQHTPNERLLTIIADVTGGQNLGDNPADSFAITQEPRTAIAPIWHWLLLAAILLFPFDIAIRRLIITRSDIKRLRLFVFGDDTNAAPDERLSSLFIARDRAREKTLAGESDSTTIAALRKTRRNRQTAESDDDLPQQAKEPKPPSRFASKAPEKPVAGSGSTVGNLLKRRKSDDEML
ncbi:MAG: VWA domain-containing protein [Anaerolineae bacterium]|nr:VWA domain-containing protein [Anaerolineae bacterium]MDQ7034717.1 VWA domain-containing protein [Anaerolineae bacterium]